MSDDGQHDIGATVRQWTDVISRARFDKVIASTKPGSYIKACNVKLVASRMAHYADANGRRVFPGIARLAADCQVSYALAGRVVAGLRDLGLIELVRRGVRRGARSEREMTDEYRLTLPADLFERLTVPTPSDYRGVVAVIAKPHRPDYRTQDRPLLDRPVPTQDRPLLDRPAGDESNSGRDTLTAVSECGRETDLTPDGPPATYTQDLVTRTTHHSENALTAQLTPTRVCEAESEDPNFGLDEGGPPTLRVVTGGRPMSSLQSIPRALWPAAVPSLDPTPGEQARAALRSKLADRKQDPKRGRRTG